jgi:type IV secretion system protein TrbL
MERIAPERCIAIVFLLGLLLVMANRAYAQDGSVLIDLENGMRSAAAGWEARIMQAARSLFWILAGIEISIAAVWLAIQSASLDSWFAELVRRILFVGLFLFVLEQGPDLAKAVVDSLFQIGAGSGSASPADVFNAGLRGLRNVRTCKVWNFRRQCPSHRCCICHGCCCCLLRACRSDLCLNHG